MKKYAVWFMLVTFSVMILFHVLVLIGIVPYQMVWGGRLSSPTDMYRFETVSLALNGVFLLAVLAKSELIRLPVSQKILTVLFWLMTLLFGLNTVGNLLSHNDLEKMIFTPITILLTLSSFILARERG